MKRAEKIKVLITERKAAGKYREQMKIEAGSTGHGYATLFGRFLDASVTHIHIEDPYIRAFHQVSFYPRASLLEILFIDFLGIAQNFSKNFLEFLKVLRHL